MRNIVLMLAIAIGCILPVPTYADSPSSALILAVRDGNVPAAQALVAKGADINAKDVTGATPLFYATSKAMAEYLISKDARVNVKDKAGESPLHVAAANNRKEVVDALAAHGAKDDLFSAAYRGEAIKVKSLIAQGANVNAKDSKGLTPLSVTTNNDVLNDLITHGANIEAGIGHLVGLARVWRWSYYDKEEVYYKKSSPMPFTFIVLRQGKGIPRRIIYSEKIADSPFRTMFQYLDTVDNVLFLIYGDRPFGINVYNEENGIVVKVLVAHSDNFPDIYYGKNGNQCIKVSNKDKYEFFERNNSSKRYEPTKQCPIGGDQIW